jgi:hypothetical protein
MPVTVFALGLPTQVSTSTPSTMSLVQFATGSAEALGVPVMATTLIALAANKSRPASDASVTPAVPVPGAAVATRPWPPRTRVPRLRVVVGGWLKNRREPRCRPLY